MRSAPSAANATKIPGDNAPPGKLKLVQSVVVRVTLLALSIMSFYLAKLLITGTLAFSNPWVSPLLITATISIGCIALFYAIFWSTKQAHAPSTHSAPIKHEINSENNSSNIPEAIRTSVDSFSGRTNISISEATTLTSIVSTPTSILTDLVHEAHTRESQIDQTTETTINHSNESLGGSDEATHPTHENQTLQTLVDVEPTTTHTSSTSIPVILPSAKESPTQHSKSTKTTTTLPNSSPATTSSAATSTSVKSVQIVQRQESKAKSTSLNLIDFYTNGTVASIRSDAQSPSFTLNDFLNNPIDPSKLDFQMPWVFPQDNGVPGQQGTPILDTATIEAFKASPPLQKQILKSLYKMLEYSGYDLNPPLKRDVEIATNPTIKKSDTYKARGTEICCDCVWGIPYAFNKAKGAAQFTRIAQMLTTLRLLGLSQYSKSFFTVLKIVKDTEGHHPIAGTIISEEMFQKWKTASGDNSSN